jgi:hypothetical protein
MELRMGGVTELAAEHRDGWSEQPEDGAAVPRWAECRPPRRVR